MSAFLSHCHLCGKEIKEGDLISGWVEFSYATFPICEPCGDES